MNRSQDPYPNQRFFEIYVKMSLYTYIFSPIFSIIRYPNDIFIYEVFQEIPEE